METKWIDIKNQDVCHIWKCEDCKTKVILKPDWYQDNGTPVCCECDRDMYYVKAQTRVNLDELRIIELAFVEYAIPTLIEYDANGRLRGTDLPVFERVLKNIQKLIKKKRY